MNKSDFVCHSLYLTGCSRGSYLVHSWFIVHTIVEKKNRLQEVRCHVQRWVDTCGRHFYKLPHAECGLEVIHCPCYTLAVGKMVQLY